MTAKKYIVVFLVVGLLFSISCAISQQPMLQSGNYTLINLTKFAAENPIDPKIGSLSNQVVLGENASVNFAQLAPGSHFGAQYHSNSDEMDYVIQGQANATLNGKVILVKAGDMLYLPAGTVHDFEALGNENLQVFVVFAPPLGEKDRHLV
jgi:mannose-6-phosphate isomerase-like protein (cupin superfamily)